MAEDNQISMLAWYPSTEAPRALPLISRLDLKSVAWKGANEKRRLTVTCKAAGVIRYLELTPG